MILVDKYPIISRSNRQSEQFDREASPLGLDHGRSCRGLRGGAAALAE